ncbi:heparinase II/III family protein [candidate division KSB1 bacterium]
MNVNIKIRYLLIIILFIIYVLSLSIPQVTFAAEKQNNLSLSQPYSIETLKNIIIPAENWNPFPTASQREQWLSLPEDIRQGHIALGENLLGHKWAPLPATLFLEYARIGNRSNYESRHFPRRRNLINLVIAECIEGKGRFLDDIANGVWAICEETYWGVPAHLSMQNAGSGLPDASEPTIDLFAAETGALLAWTYYLLHLQLDKVSPLICRRIKQEMEKKIISPFMNRDDFWWMGLKNDNPVNNWNPWCNSNCLAAALVFEQDINKRAAFVKKALNSLDRFIAVYAPDGGCDEGPSYWNVAGGALFDCLEILKNASGDKINFYNKSLIQEIGRYIYRVHIDDKYYINFADASAKVSIDGMLVWRYGKTINDPHLMSLGALAAQNMLSQNHTVTGNIGRQLHALFNASELLKAKPAQPLLKDVWFKNIQVMAVRSNDGSSDGLYLAAKGGHNDESHNHNDIGNFILYKDGQPMIIDVGVETYSRKTFSKERYTIWTMQSAYHNLPTVNGIMQKEGRNFQARNVSHKVTESSAQMTLDIAGAYPEAAEINYWKRTVKLNRGKNVEITDSYSLKNKSSELTLNLMTPCNVTIMEKGKIELRNTQSSSEPVSVQLSYDDGKLTPRVEKIFINDNRLKSVWGSQINRIIFQADNPPKKDKWKLKISQ